MKILNLVLLFLALISLAMSCDDKVASGIDDSYYIYITGDSGRVVDISYLQREQKEYAKENVTVTEQATLPFFKEAHIVQFIGDAVPECFLQVNSENDSTTKAIIFDNALQLADGKCGIIAAFYTENAVNDCEYYKDISKDSILVYLKSINYPCYMEFSKGDTLKKVDLYDWWGW